MGHLSGNSITDPDEKHLVDAEHHLSPHPMNDDERSGIHVKGEDGRDIGNKSEGDEDTKLEQPASLGNYFV